MSYIGVQQSACLSYFRVILFIVVKIVLLYNRVVLDSIVNSTLPPFRITSYRVNVNYINIFEINYPHFV